MAVPMALSMERSTPPSASQFVALGLLALTLAGLWQQHGIASTELAVLSGIRDHETLAVEPATGARSTEDPDPTGIVNSLTVPVPPASAAVQEGSPVQPIEPVVQAGETVAMAAPAEPPSQQRLPLPRGAARWQRDFIMAVVPGARESQRKTGVPASVTLAQAILESDWGRSKLTREANNLFGIKALRGPGSAGVYEIETWEVQGGEDVTVLAAFRAYTSLADSIVDHGLWFHDNRRYRKALDVGDDPRAFAYAINEAGYATDPAYAPKLIGLMDKFDLYAYDVLPGDQI
jgi:flagellum-specific peptidoglycan hydrolase FlgJ